MATKSDTRILPLAAERIDPPHPALEPLATVLGVPIVHRLHLKEQMSGFVEDVLEKCRG